MRPQTDGHRDVRARGATWVRRVLLLAAGILLLPLGALWAFQRRLVYLPTGDVPPVASVLPGAEDVAIDTADGLRLGAWLLPPPADDAFVVIVFHGNAGNRADRAPMAAALRRAGFGVLLFDYRGYGGNPGAPTEEGLVADGLAAVGFVEDRLGLDARRVVYLGRSLGAAVALGTAERRPPAALVLVSPFASLEAVARVHYPYLPVSWLLRDHYPNEQRIRSLDVPTLVVAGSADAIVPVEQSRRVYEAAPGRRRFVEVEGAGHDDPRLTERAVAELPAFLESTVGGG